MSATGPEASAARAARRTSRHILKLVHACHTSRSAILIGSIRNPGETPTRRTAAGTGLGIPSGCRCNQGRDELKFLHGPAMLIPSLLTQGKHTSQAGDAHCASSPSLVQIDLFELLISCSLDKSLVGGLDETKTMHRAPVSRGIFLSFKKERPMQAASRNGWFELFYAKIQRPHRNPRPCHPTSQEPQ